MRRAALASGRLLFAPLGAARSGAVVQRRSYQGPAIPDSGLLHRYEAPDLDFNDQDTVNTWANEMGGADLTGSGPVYRTDILNGNPVVRFSDDRLDADISDISQPLHYYFVGAYRSLGQQYTIDGGSDFQNSFGLNASDQYRAVDGNNDPVNGSAADTDPHLWDVLVESDNIELTLDGTQDAQSGAGGETQTELVLAEQSSGGDNSAIDAAALLVYDPSASGYSESEVRSYLSDRYGLSI
jgi:hypothetical protein